MATNPHNYVVHGIDLMAPGGIEALLAYRRTQFGDATMLADQDDTSDRDDDADDQGTGNDDDADTGSDTDDQDDDGDDGSDSPEAQLEKVTRTLRKVRGEKKDAQKRVRELEAENQRLRATQNTKGTEDGDEPDNGRREAGQDALQKANTRIVKAEIKAAAAGKLANPALALRLIDPADIEVNDDGEVDEADVEDAIATLLEEYPELAVQQGPSKRFQTKGDGGAGRQARPKQLSQADLETMTPKQIAKAQAEGRLTDLLTGKRR